VDAPAALALASALVAASTNGSLATDRPESRGRKWIPSGSEAPCMCACSLSAADRGCTFCITKVSAGCAAPPLPVMRVGVGAAPALIFILAGIFLQRGRSTAAGRCCSPSMEYVGRARMSAALIHTSPSKSSAVIVSLSHSCTRSRA